LQDPNKRHRDSNPGSPVYRLHDQSRGVDVKQILSVKLFVDARHNEHGSIFTEDRTKPSPCLIEQTLTPENAAELLRP
jgi:hypothetical protein